MMYGPNAAGVHMGGGYGGVGSREEFNQYGDFGAQGRFRVGNGGNGESEAERRRAAYGEANSGVRSAEAGFTSGSGS